MTATVLGYPKAAIGRYMSSEVLTFNENLDVGTALELVRDHIDGAGDRLPAARGGRRQKTHRRHRPAPPHFQEPRRPGRRHRQTRGQRPSHQRPGGHPPAASGPTSSWPCQKQVPPRRPGAVDVRAPTLRGRPSSASLAPHLPTPLSRVDQTGASAEQLTNRSLILQRRHNGLDNPVIRQPRDLPTGYFAAGATFGSSGPTHHHPLRACLVHYRRSPGPSWSRARRREPYPRDSP